MAQFKWTLITNLSHVDLPSGERLWCKFLTIDDAERMASLRMPRQLRGAGWGCLSVFTMWLPEGEPQYKAAEGGGIFLIGNDGEVKDLTAGALEITIGDKVVTAWPQDHTKPVQIEVIELDRYPEDDFINPRLYPFQCDGTFVPHVQWGPIPSPLTAMFG